MQYAKEMAQCELCLAEHKEIFIGKNVLFILSVAVYCVK